LSKCIVSIGIPGSGKSTSMWAYANAIKDSVYISSDLIRKEVTGSEDNLSMDMKVWGLAYQRAADAIKDKKTVVFDATNSKKEDRVKLLKHLRDSGATHIEGVFFNEPLKVCLERNKKRERVVPEYVMVRMYNSLQDYPPTLEDGFDLITNKQGYHPDE